MKIVFVDKNRSLVRKLRTAAKALPKKVVKNLEIHKGDIFKYKGVIVSASNPDFTFGGSLDRLIAKKYKKECLEARTTKGNKRIGNVIFTVTVDRELKATRFRVEKAIRFALANTKKRETVLISGLGTGIGGLKEETFVTLFIKSLQTKSPVSKKIRSGGVTRWKFLREGMKSASGNCKWVKGVWQKPIKNIHLCATGYHCSQKPYDAFSYVQGEILAQVEVKGERETDKNKEVWENMRVVKAYTWTKKDSVAFSIFAAELVFANFEKLYPADDRPRKAIEAAKAWLKNPTKENEAAARSAYSAADSAARSAFAEIVEKLNVWMELRVKKLKEVK